MTAKKTLCLLLAGLMLLSLCACGIQRENTETENTDEPAAAVQTVPGYLPSRVAMPEGLNIDNFFSAMACDGDTIWLSRKTEEGGLEGVAYDTLSDSWERFPLDTGDARWPAEAQLQPAGSCLWALIREGVSWEQLEKREFPDDLGYYLFHLDRESGESSCLRIPFEGTAGTESSSLIFSGLIPLDEGRALLVSPGAAWVVDPELNILARPELPDMGGMLGFRVNGTAYYWTENGYAPFDSQTLGFGAPLPLSEEPVMFSSNNGHVFYERDRMLWSSGPDGGELSPVFSWLDVALSYGDLSGWLGLENSRGVFFYPGGDGGLIRVEPGEVPVRKVLKLGCFGDSSEEMYQYSSVSYSCSMELLDAVIRFNNTDPEYRIEIEPLVFNSENERDRLLLELATGSDLDLLDTSILPDRAVGTGLLADMLPFLDADESLSREDFIEPLFALMLQQGKLYEYTDKFNMLSIATHPGFSGEDWTVERIETLIREHPEMEPIRPNMERELLTTLFAWAATAEFIDWETMSCDFERPAFAHWLQLLKELPAGGEYNDNPQLLDFAYDLATDARFRFRNSLKDTYVLAGFPESSGTGSYFLRQGESPDAWYGSGGQNTRIGILASGTRQEAAWRFVRTLIQGSDTVELTQGIPALKAKFERALANAIDSGSGLSWIQDAFSAEDAAQIRELVYQSRGLVHTDEALLTILRSEMNAFLGGQKSAGEAARQIQSRVGLYLAEQN